MERRWLKIGAGVAGSVTTIVGLFLLLVLNFGFVITDLTGDIHCAGTYEDPCISEFLVKNPTKYNVDIFNQDEIVLDFSPAIKDYALFVPDGRCSATGSCRCELDNGEKIGFEDWRCVDFTEATKPRKDKLYVYRFPAYSETKFRLVGIKNDLADDVKWTFGTEKGELDPEWKSSKGYIANLMEWNISYSEGEENLAVDYEIINDTTTKFIVSYKDKGAYEESIAQYNSVGRFNPINVIDGKVDELRDINNVPIQKDNLIRFDREDLDLSGPTEFNINYAEIQENMSFKIGWESVTIDASGATGFSSQRASVDHTCRTPDGTFHATWEGASSDWFYGNSTDNTATWNTFEIFDLGTFLYAGITCTSDNTVYVYADNNTNIVGANSSDGFANFYSMVYTPAGIGYASCEADSNDVVHCCFIDDADDMAYLNSSSNWDTTSYVQTTEHCDIAIDTNNDIYIVESSSSTDDVTLRSSQDNFAQHTIYTGANIASSIQSTAVGISISPSNTIHVVVNDAADLQHINGTNESLTVFSTREVSTSANYAPTVGVTYDEDVYVMFTEEISCNIGTDVFQANQTSPNWDSTWTYGIRDHSETGNTCWSNVQGSLFPNINRIRDQFYYTFTDSNAFIIHNIPVPFTGISAVTIVNPTTGSPIPVNSSFNITINYTVSDEDAADITSGVSINNITIGGTQASIFTDDSITGNFHLRVNDSGADSSTVIFPTLENTDYAAFATPLTDDDVPYSLAYSSKTATQVTWTIEDDTGVAELTNFMYAAINITHITIGDKHIECGVESTTATTYAATFLTAFPDTNYQVICNPLTDADSPICILDDTPGKTVDGFEVVFNDDGGSAESVDGANWCAFSTGEYTAGEVLIKAGQDSPTDDVLTGTFTGNFPDSDYSVFIMDATSYTADGCSCEVTARNVGSFTARCEDDGDSVTNCNNEFFDWVALSNNESNQVIIEAVDQNWYTSPLWHLNITVPTFASGLKDLFLNVSEGISEESTTNTESVNYGVAADTCTYVSGNWAVTADDNCVISVSVAMDALSDFLCTGSGTFTINTGVKITGWDYRLMSVGCYYRGEGTGGFY